MCDVEVMIIYALLILQVIRLHEEFFLPGEVIMEQGNVVDQLYFVCHGVLVWFYISTNPFAIAQFLFFSSAKVSDIFSYSFLIIWIIDMLSMFSIDMYLIYVLCAHCHTSHYYFCFLSRVMPLFYIWDFLLAFKLLFVGKIFCITT